MALLQSPWFCCSAVHTLLELACFCISLGQIREPVQSVLSGKQQMASIVYSPESRGQKRPDGYGLKQKWLIKRQECGLIPASDLTSCSTCQSYHPGI